MKLRKCAAGTKPTQTDSIIRNYIHGCSNTVMAVAPDSNRILSFSFTQLTTFQNRIFEAVFTFPLHYNMIIPICQAQSNILNRQRQQWNSGDK